MKILILYRYSKLNSFNHFCNTDFYQKLNTLPNVEAKFYGVNIQQIYPSMMVCDFNAELKLLDIWKKFNFDVVIFAGKNRTFYESNENKSWIPKDAQHFPCFKILIEPDFHKYRKLTWFKEMKFDLILHRHQTNVTRAEEDFPKMKHLWFPFSVDTNIFHPNNINRINKVSFVGNSKSKSYYFRKQALNLLEQNDLIENQGLQYEEDYIKTLQQHSIYLSGSSIFGIDCAKNFEIIASGGILLTNKCYNGSSDLFKSCCVTYKNSFSDLITKTNNILKDKNKQKKLIKKGISIIQKRHTHYHRCKDLLKIIKSNLINKCVHKLNESIEPTDVVYIIGNLTEDAWKRWENSYNSLKLNKNFNTCVAEVGLTNNLQRIKSFIPDVKYYYQESDSFDASIAKNQAFKELIKSNLFVFLDVDMLVSSDFISKINLEYQINKKIFICPHHRLIETDIVDYDTIMKSILNFSTRFFTGSGVLVCDKETYQLLNGFDEEYKKWGGRDTDFYQRAKLLNKFFVAIKIETFHQYHPRDMDENRNKQRWHYRMNTCKENLNLISKIKGLIDNRYDNPLEILINNNISVCLLKQTCRDWVINKELNYPLYLGVSDINKAKSLTNRNVIFESMPRKTKEITYNKNKVKVPLPLIPYLTRLYGKNIWTQIK